MTILISVSRHWYFPELLSVPSVAIHVPKHNRLDPLTGNFHDVCRGMLPFSLLDVEQNEANI